MVALRPPLILEADSFSARCDLLPGKAQSRVSVLFALASHQLDDLNVLMYGKRWQV